MATSGQPPGPSAKRKLLELPIEIQKSIVQYVPRKHLFKLQRISHHFFSLASAEIYSNLFFRFTTTGSKDDDTPATRLSDALETFATSDHDYAKYVKCFRLSISQEDSFNAVTLARLFWPTGSDPTRMLNMAMLLMLRKASMMETFLWDVPVELTPTVYKALHKIHSIRNLRIKSAGIPIKLAISPSYMAPPGGWAAPPPGATLAQTQGQTTLAAVPAFPGNAASVAKRLGKKTKGPVDDASGSFAGFTGLASVAFTDLTSLDCLSDIANCIKASSTSLRSLSLSLSWDLAQKSRKSTTTAVAPPVNDMDDGEFSDDTEDMLNPDLPPPPSAQPVSAADAKKDKLAQDAILSKVFDLEGIAAEGKRIEKEVSQSSQTLSKGTTDGEGGDSDFSVVADLARSLTTALLAKGSQKKQDVQRALELICKATNRLVESREDAGTVRILEQPQFPTDQSASVLNASQPSTSASVSVPHIPDTSSGSPLPSGLDVQKSLEANIALCNEIDKGFLQGMESLTPSQAEEAVQQALNPASEPGSAASAASQTTFVRNGPGEPWRSIEDQKPLPPELDNDGMDLDMDHPDESTIDEGPDQEMVYGPEEPEGSPRKRPKFEQSLASGGTPKSNAASVLEKVELKVDSATSQTKAKENGGSSDYKMRKYIRAAHGLQIEEFSLYLIPLKASIVGRALDLSVLKRITLLDVGSQAPFWQLLHRLSKSMPDLGFHMIHSDDVSNALLNFLSVFDGLQELYLHKKKKKEPEHETTGQKVDIKSICKLGLRRHFDTITHLMLRNDNDENWDLGPWAVRTFCLRGSGLVELAVSMKVQTLHTFVQNITSFTSLRALYFPHLRAPNSVTGSIYESEYVSFLVDSFIHFPDRKLRYIGVAEKYAILDSPALVARRMKVVEDRRAYIEKKNRATKGKGKGKEAVRDLTHLMSLGSEAFCSSASCDEYDDDALLEHMALKVRECNVVWITNFWKIEDCKILQRGIRLGKLSWAT